MIFLEHFIFIQRIIKCSYKKRGDFVGKICCDYLYEVGEHISDGNRNLTIIDRYKGDNKERRYKYRCNICGWDDGTIKESHLKNGHGCSCCANRTIVRGINDIPTTDPWMVAYFQGGLEEASQYSRGSSCKIVPVCPTCGTVHSQPIEVHRINRKHGFSCVKCNDGYSYPEKFVYSLLQQVGCNFIMQFSSKNASWVGRYRYDFCLPEYMCLIETNGIQHYKDAIHFSRSANRVVDVEKQNDKAKQILAENNNYLYFSIDCQKSEKDWIRKSIVDSGIFDLLGILDTDIDWNKCHNFALSNLCKAVCDYKRAHPKETAQSIANHFSISIPTATSYLHIGNNIGLCHYSGYKRIKMSYQDKIIGIFDSAKEITEDSRFLNYSIRCIRAVCRGVRKTYKGYNFEYI